MSEKWENGGTEGKLIVRPSNGHSTYAWPCMAPNKSSKCTAAPRSLL